MNWTPIYAALAQAAALTGIPAAAIAWMDQPAVSSWTGGPQLKMKISPLRSLGFDYEERVDAAPPNAGNLPQTVTVVGQRQFTWTIRCEVQNSDPSTIALHYLDLLRARLSRSTTEMDILLPNGIAVVEVHPTQQIPNVKDTRAVNTYVMDVVMACAENDTDTSSDAGGFIDTVVALTNGGLQTPDGNVAPKQINETIGPA